MKDTNEAFSCMWCDVNHSSTSTLLWFRWFTNGDSDSQNGDSQEGNGSGDSKTISDEELQDMLDSDSVAPSENFLTMMVLILLSYQIDRKNVRQSFQKQEKFLDGDIQKTKLIKKNLKILVLLKIQVYLWECWFFCSKKSLDSSSVGKGTSVWLLEN